MKLEMEGPIRNKKLIDKLALLRDTDPEAFSELVMSALKLNPEAALSDPASIETKIIAIDTLISLLEKSEKYEDCSFLVNLKKSILDGSKK